MMNAMFVAIDPENIEGELEELKVLQGQLSGSPDQTATTTWKGQDVTLDQVSKIIEMVEGMIKARQHAATYAENMVRIEEFFEGLYESEDDDAYQAALISTAHNFAEKYLTLRHSKSDRFTVISILGQKLMEFAASETCEKMHQIRCHGADESILDDNHLNDKDLPDWAKNTKGRA